MNARFAMMAVAGILFTEVTGVEPKWFEAGARDYGAPLPALIAVQVRPSYPHSPPRGAAHRIARPCLVHPVVTDDVPAQRRRSSWASSRRSATRGGRRRACRG